VKRQAASERVTQDAIRNVLKNQNEPPPLAIPTGDIGPDVEGTIVAENEGPIISFVNPESDEKDVAHAPDACTEKATSVKSRIVQGNEQLSGLIVDMGKRIKTHEQISERVRAMKAELEILKDREKNMPQQNTAEGMAQKALAMEAIESCSANMDGMQSAVNHLLETIEQLKQHIREVDNIDEYNLTLTDEFKPPS
jgi:hypothetical protein